MVSRIKEKTTPQAPDENKNPIAAEFQPQTIHRPGRKQKTKSDSQPVVLVVDDNPSNIKVLGYMLMKEGYRIVIAQSGMEALKYVDLNLPDLFLLDIIMPQISGFELCRMLKKKAKTKDIPVIFITALTNTEDKLKAFQIGGEDYITKPFIQEEVIARINLVIEQRRIKIELQKAREELEHKVEERTQEVKAMQSQLIMKEKMASIGLLAAGIAHELNNPINFVYTNFDTLRENACDLRTLLKKYKKIIEKIEPADALFADLQELNEFEENINLPFILKDLDKLFLESREGFQRISSIIKSMLNFSTVDDSNRLIEFDINRGIQDTLVISRNAYKYHANIVTELGDIPSIFCHPQQLNQVFLNLIVNAAQSIAVQNREDKGTIKIKTYHEGENVYCEFSDDGAGVPEEIQARIFEPFFTTKEAGKGTGLGLSISYDIVVHKHNGTLSIKSDKENGTTFYVCLPIG